MNRRSTGFTRIAMASALVTALAAAPALAVDGVLEINQACVAAGCFPGDGPGFPVEITIPGSYRLTSNLTVPDDDTTAILLQGVRLVNLDLNGFSILGQYACGVSPPNCPGGASTSPGAPHTTGCATAASSTSAAVASALVAGA